MSTTRDIDQPKSPPPKRRMKGNLRQLSHSLSKVLRHKAPEMGFTMTPDGFVPVDEILKHSQFQKFNLAEILEVVRTCDKQRFKLEKRPDKDGHGTVLYIRANQGHSISMVDPNLLLRQLEPAELAAMSTIVHGTYKDAWISIQKQGLKRMNRNHIHFASGLPDAENGVISGMRKSCDIYIYIDAKKCASKGVTFFQSDNNVLLTAGVNDEGTLPVEYFSRVTDASGMLLMSGSTTPKNYTNNT